MNECVYERREGSTNYRHVCIQIHLSSERTHSPTPWHRAETVLGGYLAIRVSTSHLHEPQLPSPTATAIFKQDKIKRDGMNSRHTNMIPITKLPISIVYAPTIPYHRRYATLGTLCKHRQANFVPKTLRESICTTNSPSWAALCHASLCRRSNTTHNTSRNKIIASEAEM